ncbi:MAG: class I SAM-dependent RNA methyltransferase [Acidobacteriaceae bacterium]
MQLRIDRPIYGGAGLARAEGKAVFVPFTLPGELVEANITEEKRSYATAELLSVLEASEDRRSPPCGYFGKCGGCHYQHAGYPAQLAMKAAILREMLERAHIREIPEIAILSGEPLGYRNRVRLHVERNPFSLCYKYRNSHRNLPIGNCPIAAPELQRAIEVLHREGGALGLGGWVREVELFTAGDGPILASFFTDAAAKAAEQALGASWPGLLGVLPGLAGAACFSAEDDRAPAKRLAQRGEEWLVYSSQDRRYRVSIGSFFQTNRFLIDSLVREVTGEEKGDTAWDLYAGAGLFSLPLTQDFASVVAVETSASAVRDLRENLRGTTHRTVASDTAAFLRRAVEQRTPAPDLAVVDPPRAGLGAEVTSALEKLQPRKITYVSCDPATLSRDLAALLESGYRLRKIHLVDLFPQTFHLESVTHLSLG